MARSKNSPQTRVNGGCILNHAAQEVRANGTTHHLTPKEYRLLITFMQHPGEVPTRKFLMQEVWNTDFTDDTRTLEVHVCWLRKKIEEDRGNPQLILTVRGTGYMFADGKRVSR